MTTATQSQVRRRPGTAVLMIAVALATSGVVFVPLLAWHAQQVKESVLPLEREIADLKESNLDYTRDLDKTRARLAIAETQNRQTEVDSLAAQLRAAAATIVTQEQKIKDRTMLVVALQEVLRAATPEEALAKIREQQERVIALEKQVKSMGEDHQGPVFAVVDHDVPQPPKPEAPADDGWHSSPQVADEPPLQPLASASSSYPPSIQYGAAPFVPSVCQCDCPPR